MNRIGFIGGSDARRIMEGDWYNLYLEKTEQAEPVDLSDNLPVQLGSFTEEFNVGWFDQHYLEHKYHIEKQVRFAENVEGVFCRGTVDGYIHDYNAVLECKHTYDRNNMEQCIRQYMPQVQFYMFLSGADKCFLSVIFGNRRWECVQISFDKEYTDQMLLQIKKFWQHVESKTEPAWGKPAIPVDTNSIPVDSMTRRDASGDNEFISRVHDYIEQEANSKTFESAKADLKAMVGHDEREVYCDLLTIKRDKRGSLRITVKENN